MWTEVKRTCMGLYMSGAVGGPGWGNPGCYCAIYEIQETKDDGNTRTRVEMGPDCREYSEGYTALRSLYSIFLERAQNVK